MSKKAPDPTPPEQTSAAATGTNVSTAIANAFLTNPNEITPDGTRTVTQTGDYSWTDPFTGETYNVPRFTVEQTLSEAQQRIKDKQDSSAYNLSSLAEQQSGFLNDYMAEPFKYDTNAHEKWSLGLYDKLNADKQAQDNEALRTQLANQGIGIGTAAYDRAMKGLYEGQNSARDRFALDSYQTGFQSATAQRNQPINEITALMSGGQVSTPGFTTGTHIQGAPTTDNAALIANADAQRMAAWQQNQAALGGLLSGIGGIASLSDERAKEDKHKIAETEDGLGIYKFRYKGSPKVEVGLMAQEVQKKKPKAVKRGADGLLRVNYERALK